MAREIDLDDPVPSPIRAAVTLQYEGYLAAQSAFEGARSVIGDLADLPGGLDRLQRRANEAERAVVLRARRNGEVSAEVADTVMQDIESRAVRDLG